MIPTKTWRTLYQQKRELTICQEDLSTYFESDLLYGKRLDRMILGNVSLINGQIVAADPLAYLDEDTEAFYRKVPAGDYPVEAAVVIPDRGDCARYAAVRICFSEKKAVRFEEALIGDEELDELQPGEFYGFEVESGLGCICDEVSKYAFLEFAEHWCEENDLEFEEIYNEYFSQLFEESFEKNPKYQREDGDYLDWVIPGTPYHVILFETGFGDGVYPAYFGYDEDGQICQFVIQLIDLSSAYEQEIIE